MATMYHVRVLSVEGDRFVCRVTAVYPDEPLVPSRTLAFRFVWEPWYDLADGVTQHLPGGDHAITPEEARMKARAAPLAKELAGQDMDDLDWCCANADRFIRCVGVTDIVAEGAADLGPRESELGPQATYTIIATDPSWLVHLAAGMEWDTTAFDDDVHVRFQPSWRSPDVVALAKGIEAAQDFSGMPALADALQEAGCECDDILTHCRGLGPHARGCWVIDLVLGEG